MAKVTKPLFGNTATGTYAGLISFRNGPHGPEAIAPTGGPRTPPEATARLRECFAQAKAAHSAIPPTHVQVSGKWVWRILPAWPEFWRQWLADHPECLE